LSKKNFFDFNTMPKLMFQLEKIAEIQWS